MNYRLLLLSALFGACAMTQAQTKSCNIPNPVLRGVADAGCIRYAGKYYLGGVATYGDFHISTDLVNWNDRIHVFDLDNDWTRGTGARNNQVHADDISYSGGLFHLLFSVNYWGHDRHIVHITHATSPTVEGPYKEVRTDQWYENRIDPQVFQDDDGRLYLYMVKFTDGNTIWVRPLNGDFSFAGEALQQFSSQPGTWETYDNRVAEGPFVIKYRGRYYMMYNANHTAAEYGNYHLGVCEAPAPMLFNPGGKYPHPVVGSNTEPIGERFADLLRYGGRGYNGIDLHGNEVHFTLDTIPSGNLYMLVGQRGGCRLRLNGHAVNPGQNEEYAYYKVGQDMLKAGDNVINIDRQDDRGMVSHLYLYATGSSKPDEVLVTPGQPNIVRGPNGWEWWLVYMANQGWQRHQFVDRIHFVNGRLTVDGITGSTTPGFHPAPAKPQHCGTSMHCLPPTLAECCLLEVTSKRDGTPEEWRIEKNGNMLTAWKNKTLVCDHRLTADRHLMDSLLHEAKADEVAWVSYCEGFDEYGPYFNGWSNDAHSATATADGLCMESGKPLFKVPAAEDYSFSAEFADSSPEAGQYGIYAAYEDERNFVRLTIDAQRQKLITEQAANGKIKRAETDLSHTLVHYPDIKYSDSFEKQYRFGSETFVSAVEYPHLDASHDGYASNLSIEQRERAYRDDMAAMMTLEYLDSRTGKWLPISYTEGRSDNAAWQRVAFPQVKTRALRMINKAPRQNDRNIYKIKTTRDFEASIQLRVEKRGQEIHVFVGQREMPTVRMEKAAPARIALFSNAGNGVKVKNTLYYVVN